MYKPKFLFSVLVLLLCATGVFAQTEEKIQSEPSYEVLLQVLVASNNPGGEKLPPSLSKVVKKLKSEYSFSKYDVAASFLERVSTGGGVDHKGLLNQLGQTPENGTYFSDWGLYGLKATENSVGQNVIHFQQFRFGARVPVVVSNANDAKGDNNRVINYEAIGVNVSRFNLPENVPTIVGSLSTQKTDEFVFLVLTVRKAE